MQRLNRQPAAVKHDKDEKKKKENIGNLQVMKYSSLPLIGTIRSSLTSTVIIPPHFPRQPCWIHTIVMAVNTTRICTGPGTWSVRHQ
jgi:hypothetical protein